MTGIASLALVDSPGFAAEIWLPAGVALGAVILYGNHVWPGLLLGAYLVNAWIGMENPNATSVYETLGVSIPISIGATLQALAGAFLLRRFGGFPNPLVSAREIIAFLILGGPVSCTIAASFSVLALALSGQMPGASPVSTLGTWWIGDTIGVFVVTPLILAWGLPRKNWGARRGVITAPIVISCLLTALAVSYVADRQTSQLRAQFEKEAIRLASAVDKSLSIHLGVVESLARLHGASDHVSRSDFKSFVEYSLGKHPGIKALSWNPRVLASQRPAFEAERQQEGFTQFRITELNAEGSKATAATREEYIVIDYIEPFQKNVDAFGYDIASDPTRREALIRAQDTGQLTTTGRIEFVQESRKQFGILALVPVYERGSSSQSVVQRRQNLAGYMVGVFRGADIVQTAVTSLDHEEIACRLIDESAPPDEKILFENHVAATGAHYLDEPDSLAGSTPIRLSHEFSMGGRQWRFEVAPTQSYLSGHRSEQTWLAMLAGMFITGLVAAFVLVISGRSVELRKIVKQRTGDLRASERRFRRIFETVNEGIWVIDAQGRTLMANPQLEAMLGYERQELTGKSLFDFMDSPDAGSAREKFLPSQSVSRQQGEQRFRRKDGSALFAWYSIAPVVDDEDFFSGTLVTLTDITGRKQLEDQVRQSQKMEAVGQLTGGIAHDFNNMLSIVIGNLDLLATRLKDRPELREFVDAAYRGAIRGADITKKLLSFSRTGGGKPQVTNVNDFIKGMERLIARSLTPKVTVKTELEPNLWPTFIDPGELENTLLNLALNANDAMPEGGTLLIQTFNKRLNKEYCRLNPEIPAGEYILIAVGDTGVGMPPNVAAKIFQPFFTTKDAGRGTGLGLSMVYGFVKRSGGHVKVYSEPGRGTTFRIYLPRVSENLGGAGATEANDLQVTGGQETVLVVDDEEALLAIAGLHLKSLGYRTLTASNARQALELLQQHDDIDLLFSDVIMPAGMDGFELAREAQKIRPGLRVLLSSGFTATPDTDEEDSELPSYQKRRNILAKPYNQAELARALRRALDGDLK